MAAFPGSSSGLVSGVAATLAQALPAEGPGKDLAREVRDLLQDGRFAVAEALADATLRRVDACAPERIELECLAAEAGRRGNRKLAPETLAQARSAAELAAELFGADDPRAADPLLQLGALHCVRREWPEARRALERSVELLPTSSSGKDAREATALAYLAIQALSADGDVDRALELLAGADRTLDRAGFLESPQRAWIHDMRGNVLANLDRPEDALRELRASLDMRRRTQHEGHPLLANTLQSLGTVQNQLGRLAEARASYEEVLLILEGRSEFAWTLGDVRTKLGAVCQDLEDHDGARASFERALLELEAAGQQRSPVYAGVLENLGRLAYARREFDVARELAARGLSILDAVSGGVAPRARASLGLFAGWIELQRNPPDRDRAQVFAEEAAAAGEPRAAELLAWIAADRGDLPRARELLSVRAADIRGKGGADAPHLAYVLRDLARVDFLRGDVEGALAGSLEGETHAREAWEASALGLEDLSALGLESSARLAMALNPAVCAAARIGRPDASERVWDALLLSRDRVLHECEERLALARATGTPELLRARESLARARQALAGLHVRRRRSPDPALFDEAIAAARRARESCERDLADLARIGRPAPSLRASVREIRSALDAGVGVVRLCLADRPPPSTAKEASRLSWEPCYFACVLGSGTQGPRILELGPKAEIDELVSRLLGRIRDGGGPREAAPVAAALRRRILDPVLSALPGVRLLHVVPESELCRVPFVALCSDDGSFLVESGPTLFVLGSEIDLLRPPSGSGSGLLALGDPAFPQGDAISDAPGLPQSRGEIEAVRRSWGKSRFAREGAIELLGAEATEMRFRRSIQGRRVVHVATHGFFEEEGTPALDPGLRGPSKSSAPRTTPSIPSRPTALPFLRSGLVFAGGSSSASEDDGILTTEEVLALDLGGVDWVVLSACETGVGEIRLFEGVLGLQRAMRLAGARTVIASLWPVEDRWARVFMEALYRARFEEGRSTAEAMRAAELDVLARLRRDGEEPLPRRWASFVAVGDWR